MQYHGIEKETAHSGCTVNDLPIYPLSVYDEEKPKTTYSIVVIMNISDLRFEKSDIKVALCIGTEAEIGYLEDYLNSPLPYIKAINYCFYPISQEDFKKFNSSMLQGHCKAYRLRTSPNYTNPCQWNREVYDRILHLYTDVHTKKRIKLFGR